ncbi:hypothetical protein Tco_0761289 [Tanacetum coccineum]
MAPAPSSAISEALAGVVGDCTVDGEANEAVLKMRNENSIPEFIEGYEKCQMLLGKAYFRFVYLLTVSIYRPLIPVIYYAL